jgi:PAS domain-containing protein
VGSGRAPLHFLFWRARGQSRHDSRRRHRTRLHGKRTDHPEDVEEVRAAFERLWRGENCEVAFRVITPGGEERCIREIGHPVFDEAGKVVQEIGASPDVTRQKSLESIQREAENGLMPAIEALPPMLRR